jgi:hypothetical protein
MAKVWGECCRVFEYSARGSVGITQISFHIGMERIGMKKLVDVFHTLKCFVMFKHLKMIS